MDFNPIIDSLPDTFQGCPVRSDFKQGIRFFAMIADNSIPEDQRGMLILRLFFPQTLPDDPWQFIEYFIAGGKEKTKSQSGPRVFDFNVDAGRVYAAFMQTYKIDLRTAEMHWWIFLELFQGLPEDTMLLKVIDLRGKKAPKYADAEYKSNLQKAKRAFAIGGSADSAASLGNTLKAWAGR